MSGDLSAIFREAAMVHAAATASGAADAANRAHDCEASALRQMRLMPDKGRGILTGLLEDGDPTVRSHAATALLPLDESVAISVLEEVSKARVPIISFNAEMVLREWRAGRLRTPFGVATEPPLGSNSEET